MEISPTQSSPLSQAQKSKVGLTDNFETFLTLLTTQLQNQDPLDPLETNEFTSQLVQFTSVEQAISTNDNLESLLILTQAASANSAVNYIGKSITAEGDTTTLESGQAQWQYQLDAQSANTTLIVSDESGKIVYSQSGATEAGEHSFTWDGKDNAGNTLPDGPYSLQVSATDADKISVNAQTFVAGIVTGVDIEGLEPFVKLGQVSYRLADIRSIEEITPGP